MPQEVKIDFKQIKASISIDRVLEHYGVSARRVNTVYLRADCPLPSHTSKESKDSFTVNTEKNLWCCKSDSCVQNSKVKGGDVLDFVKLMEGVKTALEAAKKLTDWFPENQKPRQTNDEVSVRAESQSNSTPVLEENKPLAFELKGICYCDYLKGRGITEETASKFGMGYFPGKGSMAGRVVIPIRDEKGELVAYAGRAIGDEEPRYKLPPGFQKSLVLYNLHRIGDQVETIILVEGFFSAIWLDQCGFPNVVSLMGKTISDAQLALLNFPKVILLVEGNEPGRTAAPETAARIATKSFVRVLHLADGKQPDHLSKEELESILNPLLS